MKYKNLNRNTTTAYRHYGQIKVGTVKDIVRGVIYFTNGDCVPAFSVNGYPFSNIS